MLGLELDIINRWLNKSFRCEDITLDNSVITDRASGQKIQLPDEVFKEIAKAKRREHLRKTSQY